MRRRQRNVPALDHPRDQRKRVEEEPDPRHGERSLSAFLPPSGQLDQKQSGAQKIKKEGDLEEENVHMATSPLNFEGILF